MKNTFARVYIRLHDLTRVEQGQDLVEYALLCTMISLALISAVGGISSAVNTAFSNISSTLA